KDARHILRRTSPLLRSALHTPDRQERAVHRTRCRSGAPHGSHSRRTGTSSTRLVFAQGHARAGGAWSCLSRRPSRITACAREGTPPPGARRVRAPPALEWTARQTSAVTPVDLALVQIDWTIGVP